MVAATTSGAAEPVYRGDLKGHDDWVTCIRAADGDDSVLLSTSRDKKLMVWNYCPDKQEGAAGYARRAYTGHSQAIQDFCLSSNSKYAITASWDKTMRLWDIETGESMRTFIGHTSDVFSVALSPDNRQIVSGSRDKTIRLWNTMASCKFVLEENGHSDWVSCVRFSPTQDQTLVVSAGWDRVVKVWDLTNCKLHSNLMGHTSALHTVTISPDGSLCASGGKDGVAMLWDVSDCKHLYSINAESPINCLAFSPCQYWLAAATDQGVRIWSLEDKKVLFEIARPVGEKKANALEKPEYPRKSSFTPWCTCLAWSSDGRTLFTGHSDGHIGAYEPRAENAQY